MAWSYGFYLYTVWYRVKIKWGMYRFYNNILTFYVFALAHRALCYVTVTLVTWLPLVTGNYPPWDTESKSVMISSLW